MFIVSNDYERSQLLGFVGSKQAQSGIIWGNKEKSCVIITSGGKGGKSAGYGDVRNIDGSILYIGQGEKGNQDPTKFANSLLINGERSVLFFSTRELSTKQRKERGSHKKLYTFNGFYKVVSWNYFVPTEGKRMNDRLLQFLLLPEENVYNQGLLSLSEEEEESPFLLKEPGDDLYYLRKKLTNKNNKPNKGISDPAEYFIRSKEIVDYAKKRANGICEMCNQLAPFSDEKNSPFLEVHHILKLADDGPDTPENVAAICPNCHKEAHFGKKKEEIKERLVRIIGTKEAEIDRNQISR